MGKVIEFRPQSPSSPKLRADVPPFDPSNPVHLRAWETLYDFGKNNARRLYPDLFGDVGDHLSSGEA